MIDWNTVYANDTKTSSCAMTNIGTGAWIEFDLGQEFVIKNISLQPRYSHSSSPSSDVGNTVQAGSTSCGTWPSGVTNDWANFTCPPNTKASTIRVTQTKNMALTLCNIVVYGRFEGTSNVKSYILTDY